MLENLMAATSDTVNMATYLQPCNNINEITLIFILQPFLSAEKNKTNETTKKYGVYTTTAYRQCDASRGSERRKSGTKHLIVNNSLCLLLWRIDIMVCKYVF